MAEQKQGQQYNDDAADVLAVLLIALIVIGTAVYWLKTI